MKEDMPAKTPYLIPRLGFPNTADMYNFDWRVSYKYDYQWKRYESCVFKHRCIPLLTNHLPAVQIGTPRMTVLIQVSDNQMTATWPSPFSRRFCFQFVNNVTRNANIRAIKRRMRKATMNDHRFSSA